MTEAHRKKYILISILISLILQFIVFFAISYGVDIRRGTIPARLVRNEMSRQNVVAFENIQGSLVYLVYENENYSMLVYEVGLISGRQLFLGSVEDGYSAIISSRWQSFTVTNNAGTIEIVPRHNPNSFRATHWRQVGGVATLLFVSTARLMYVICFKRRLERA